MRISEIRIDGLRNLTQVQADLAPGFNLVLGANGAGKTSFLEALHLLAHGRSFRSSAADSLIGIGGEGFSIFALSERSGPKRQQRLGMAMSAGDGWQLRQDQQPVSTLSEFVRQLAVITLEPNSHELISGSSEGRRRFLDWLLFHVEPEFHGAWRRYARALKQRNALLRARLVSDRELSAWEAELVISGELMDLQRRSLLERIWPELLGAASELAPELSFSALKYRSGWAADQSLAEALLSGRESDRDRGFTQRGPHRADWRLILSSGLDHDQLSRGQAKLAAFSALLGQARVFLAARGETPILLCDDLAAELDTEHQLNLTRFLIGTGSQVVVTGTGAPDTPASVPAARMFHVEQGRISQLL